MKISELIELLAQVIVSDENFNLESVHYFDSDINRGKVLYLNGKSDDGKIYSVKIFGPEK